MKLYFAANPLIADHQKAIRIALNLSSAAKKWFYHIQKNNIQPIESMPLEGLLVELRVAFTIPIEFKPQEDSYAKQSTCLSWILMFSSLGLHTTSVMMYHTPKPRIDSLRISRTKQGYIQKSTNLYHWTMPSPQHSPMMQQGMVTWKETTDKKIEMVHSEVVEAGTTTAIGVATLLVMAGSTIIAIEARTMAGMARMAVVEVEEPL